MSELIDNEIHTIYYHRHPYPFRFGSYLALLRSLTIKPLVIQLYPQSKLTHQTYERLMRTRQLIRTLIYFGLESDKGQTAIDSINQAHKTVIANNDDISIFYQPSFLNRFAGTPAFRSKLFQHKINSKLLTSGALSANKCPSKIYSPILIPSLYLNNNTNPSIWAIVTKALNWQHAQSMS